MVDVPSLERDIDVRLQAGDVNAGLTLAIEGYGPEVLAFVRGITGSAELAHDVFAQACEDLVGSLDKFRGECAFRSWFYAVARNAALRGRDEVQRHAHERLSAAPELAEAVRTATARHQQTGWKSRFRELRAKLSPEDRELLTLRVDRRLSWREVAQIMAGPTGSPAAVEPMLRKRFERLRAELRRHAEEAGWWDEL